MKFPIIDARHVGVTYTTGPFWDQRTTHAVKSMTLEIGEGETLGLVGESGSGKTSFGRLCLGITGSTDGAILFDRQLIGPKNKPPAGKLSVVLQNPDWALNPRMIVESTVTEPLVIVRRTSRKERRSEAKRALEMVGLDASFAERYPHELSGGQRQRVAIARALITEPRFIVFDEAVSALDVSVQTQVLNLIMDLQQKHGFAALFISHDLAATRYVSHRMAVMYAGSLMELGPSDLFYENPQHPYSRALSISLAEERHKEFALKGAVGDDLKGDGCPLALRCPWSMERCHKETPELRLLGSGATACHRAEEVCEA